ncbi:transposase [Gluconobacter oxydans]|uniref:transposase n=1 Tax=Gluconobacter oxydans TaxID=442 RepID=UPI0039E9BED3
MDNLPTHNGAAARVAVEAVGAWLLFQPPYSPDFNPIENIFAKIKVWIRGDAIANSRRSSGHRYTAIDDISHNHASACFSATGYETD